MAFFPRFTTISVLTFRKELVFSSNLVVVPSPLMSCWAELRQSSYTLRVQSFIPPDGESTFVRGSIILGFLSPFQWYGFGSLFKGNVNPPTSRETPWLFNYVCNKCQDKAKEVFIDFKQVGTQRFWSHCIFWKPYFSRFSHISVVHKLMQKRFMCTHMMCTSAKLLPSCAFWFSLLKGILWLIVNTMRYEANTMNRSQLTGELQVYLRKTQWSFEEDQ